MMSYDQYFIINSNFTRNHEITIVCKVKTELQLCNVLYYIVVWKTIHIMYTLCMYTHATRIIHMSKSSTS